MCESCVRESIRRGKKEDEALSGEKQTEMKGKKVEEGRAANTERK